MSVRRIGEHTIHPLADYASVPPLPPVKSVDPATYMGPTEESNWVIYPRLLVGAYPSSVHDATNTSILSSILRLGATTFVCLQQEYQHEGVLEHEWRSGAKLRPYIFDAIKLIDKLPASFFPADRGKPSGLEFVHFPIQDCSIANDSSVLQLARDLVKRLVRGETMYLHCWGGHGRTGTVVSIMLGIMYGASPVDAMRWVQFCHDLRVAPMGVPSPQTETQRQQVIRILNTIQRGAGPSRTLGDAAPAVSGSPRNQSGKPVMVRAGAGASPQSTARATSAAASRAGGGSVGGGGAGMSATTRPVSAVTGGGVGVTQQASSPQAARGGGGVGAAGKWPQGGGVAGKAGGGGGRTGRSGAAASSPGGVTGKSAATLVAQAYGDAAASAPPPALPLADGRASPPMEHLSPRPASVASVEGAGDAASGAGSGADNNAPKSFTNAILEDKVATAVAPLASSSGTVLGVAPLSLTQRRTAAAAFSQYNTAQNALRNPPPVIAATSAGRALFSQTASAGFAAAASGVGQGARTIPAAERLGAPVAKSGFRSIAK